MAKLHLGDSLEVLKSLPENSIDSIVTDPPYGLAFMGKKWDYDVPSVDLWKEALRVLKPGGHLLSFGGTRTYHRMVVNIEDAGFEIRDQIQWLYGSGFPKSLNISKAIDKEAGAEREVIGQSPNWRPAKTKGGAGFDKDVGEGDVEINITAPATDLAKQWDGWGTALKPSNEPICLARKPISESTVAKNVVKWGTGGINVDECRVETEDPNDDLFRVKHSGDGRSPVVGNFGINKKAFSNTVPSGRWPANTLFSCTCENEGKHDVETCAAGIRGDIGGASRFFYCAKSSKKERGEGNVHPTIKPIKLMEYLIKLVTPPNGVVLDPFMGSGTTLVAAKQLGFDGVGIEREAEYYEIAKRRVEG